MCKDKITEEGIFLPGLHAVSYTHLDVYKRQRFIKAYYPDLPTQAFVHYGNFIGETLKIAAEEQVPHVTLGVMTVSYTHLDVYKRQSSLRAAITGTRIPKPRASGKTS